MVDVKEAAAMTVPEKKQMNAGVELLLKRMETHPEEFYTDDPYTIGNGTKWGALMQRFEKFLDDEDYTALNEGMKKLMQQKLTEKVLEGLVDPTQNNLTRILREKARLGAIPDGMFGSATIKAEGGTVTWGSK